MNNTAGILYELPDGRIAYTYGLNNVDKVASYYFDDGCGGREVSYDAFQRWTPRRDLEDFPNARDPLLPYSFDLVWDIKYTSELRRALAEGHEDLDDIKEFMVHFGIVLDSPNAHTAAPTPNAPATIDGTTADGTVAPTDTTVPAAGCAP